MQPEPEGTTPMLRKLKWVGALYIASKIGMVAVALTLAVAFNGEEKSSNTQLLSITQQK
jgi:hypothetical protein